MSAEPYYRGRADYRVSNIMPPKEYTSIEKMQWDAGWRDEHLRNPDPILIQNMQQVVYDFRGGRGIQEEQIDQLEVFAEQLMRARK